MRKIDIISCSGIAKTFAGLMLSIFAVNNILSLPRAIQTYDSNNFLLLLESLTEDNSDEVARNIADDFRRRRIEKGLTRQAVAEKSGVAPANVARFEQKGLISLGNLIKLAMAAGYVAEVKNIFAEPKYTTMEELLTIRANSGKKKAYHPKRTASDV